MPGQRFIGVDGSDLLGRRVATSPAQSLMVCPLVPATAVVAGGWMHDVYRLAYERAQAGVVLAKKTYDRVSQLAEHGNAPQARLDQATDSLHENECGLDQAKSAYEHAVNGYTREEHEIAVANVQKAIADITTVQAIIDHRWWSTRRSPPRSTSATWSSANTFPPACRGSL